MTQPPIITFSGNRIDRADMIRTDPEAAARAWSSPDAAELVLAGLLPTWRDGRMERRPVDRAAGPENYALLGMEGHDAPLFVRLSPDAPHAQRFQMSLIAAFSEAEPSELGLYGMARSLVDWHARHRFCAQCGAPTLTVKAGWSRRCEGCGAEHFPRVDPVTIMLPEYRGRVLIGRQSRFPAGRYSALAGFVEPGETIEEAVARELYEEAGIRVHDVEYVASQPWPFPSSLMIACLARSESDVLTIDYTELEDAIWVTADEVRAALAGDPEAPFIAPPPHAVAWHLFRRWLDRQPTA